MQISLSKSTDGTTKDYKVHIGKITLYFSYETLVGISVPRNGEGASEQFQRYRVENSWGPTTGKHINNHGLRDAPIVDHDDLFRIVQEALHKQAMDLIKYRLAA